jgi:hypothetical protein
MPLVQLGTITDDRLARRIAGAMNMYMLSWHATAKDGKTVLEVYADVEENEARLLEAMRQ